MSDTVRETHNVREAITRHERFLNLAIIDIGEALTSISNMRQAGTALGGYGDAQLKLRRAIAALDGELFMPERAPQHAEKAKSGAI